MFLFLLEIAGIRIRTKTKSKIVEEDPKNSRRYEGFIRMTTAGKYDIDLEIKAVKKLPVFKGKKVLFEVRRNYSANRTASFDWIIYQLGKKLLLESRAGETYNALFSQDFTKGTIYLKQQKGVSGWKMSQLVFGPLQLLLMHYLAINKLGVLVHSSGIKHNKEGILFVGATQHGKSTSARLWKAAASVEVLNDDRIVVRRVGKDIFMFGTPWHGDFSDYYETIASSAPLKKMFFIYHHPHNKVLPVKEIEGFQRFFPNTFPIFWDKESMDFTANFLCEVLERVPAFSLGFVKEQSAVEHVRQELGI